MAKNIKCFIILCMAIVVIPCYTQATDLNVLEDQFQQEANRIMSTINEQKNNPESVNILIVGLFITVIISMIFESFVRGFKYKIKEKRQQDEDVTPLRKRLWITYGVHGIVILIIFFISKYVIKIIDLYNIFFIIVSVCMVEIAPFLQIRMRKRNRREDDTTH